MSKWDFSGWATRNDLLCADGRTIRQNAFKCNDGQTVPLVYNHDHNDPNAVLGHALLENRKEGVYAYCKFNESESGKAMKEAVKHGDVKSLSIYANKLQQIGHDVVHGTIRELSLVLAGANPGAFIDSVLAHSEDGEEEVHIGYDENIMIYHSEEKAEDEVSEKDDDEPVIEHSDEPEKEDNAEMLDVTNDMESIIDSMTDEQKEVLDTLVGMALEENPNDYEDDINDSEEGEDNEMKHNVFDTDNKQQTNDLFLSHADQQGIIAMAKSSSCGSLQDAIDSYIERNDSLAHGDIYDNMTIKGDIIEQLFPDYKDVKPGAPELVTNDQSWIESVINKTHKSPISRIRTRQIDITDESNAENELRALGYKKGDKKAVAGAMKMIKRTTDPQTVYRKDSLHRDDIIDITDFSVVDYQYQIMKMNLKEEIAKAIMIGDGRTDTDANKISEDHIRSIWNDDELYTIHADVDIAAAKATLQGTNTSANFGDNYVYAEAIITAALYAREKYKGSGSLEFYCTPHLLNVMLLARDLNGRRIYDSRSDLEAALNVTAIHTVEQFEGKVRTDSTKGDRKLLGLFVNLADYQVGSTKGGEITKFSQFDIDFNQEKTLIETRLSGALIKLRSAIALEEPVVKTENVAG